jgi:hypothetical protein
METSIHDRPSFTQLVLLLTITVAIACALANPASAQRRSRNHRAVRASSIPQTTVTGGLVTRDLSSGLETPESLVQALVGPGAIVSNVRYTGGRSSAGTFSGGTAAIGFENGVILSSGDIASVVGPLNTGPDGADGEFNLPGDPDLDLLIGSYCCTHDAAVLEFDLACPSATAASFEFVFASDEYDQVPPPVDDLFVCFVNGQNVALLPGSNAPVTLQTLNCGQGSSWPSGPNCSFYRTNDCDRLAVGFPCSNLPTEMDGLTVVLSATAALHAGTNHVKLAIADALDDEVDSVVFLRCQSFLYVPGEPVFEAPSHCETTLNAWAEGTFDLDVVAWATNHLPGASITLDATGDSIPLANGIFLPPLPTNPAQPGMTHFRWTPTVADIGQHHLEFTATDQLQHSALLDIPIQVSMPGPPVFEAPSPCGQILDAFAGAPFTCGITAAGWTAIACRVNGRSGPPVVLSVTGDAAALAAGIFDPPLPTGPEQRASTQFHWTPTTLDVGLHHLEFTATDPMQQSVSCDLTIRVSLPAPIFQEPTPCGQIVDAAAGLPFAFDVAASATNGAPDQSVRLSVTGDALPLANGAFLPPLPTDPAQPATTHFEWTPTLADAGLYHLEFTATDQLQQTATCDVTIRVSVHEPVFESPSPCYQTLNAAPGMPFTFEVVASATNEAPGQSVTLSVTGDALPLAAGTFVPPLPAGPAQPVTSQFQWTPTSADVGVYHLDFTATDQWSQSTPCHVTVRVLGAPGINVCLPGVGTVRGCPCGNPPSNSPAGCDNSAATGGARLDAVGVPDPYNCSVVFTSTGEKPTALSVLFQGGSFLASGVTYGQGVRCVGGTLRRLYVKSAFGGSITAPQSGDLSVAARSAALGDYLGNGSIRYYAVYYRDPTVLGGCPPSAAFNITQTLRIQWIQL